jgi:hypothetical protein
MLLLLTAACGGDDGVPRGPAAFGTLAIEWSIDDETAPARCEALGSNGFEALLFRPGGARWTEIEAPCDDFLIEVDVSAGTYFIRSRLVDPFDRSVTRQVDSAYFNVNLTERTSVSVDFPPRTFLGGGGSGGEAGGGAGGEAGSSD